MILRNYHSFTNSRTINSFLCKWIIQCCKYAIRRENLWIFLTYTKDMNSKKLQATEKRITNYNQLGSIAWEHTKCSLSLFPSVAHMQGFFYYCNYVTVDVMCEIRDPKLLKIGRCRSCRWSVCHAYIEKGNPFSLFLVIQRLLVIFVCPLTIGFPCSGKITRDK